MKASPYVDPVQYLEVSLPPLPCDDPDDYNYPRRYRWHLNFMLSPWECLYGRGCPGLVGVQDHQTYSDIGCCTKGAWFEDQQDLADVTAMYEQLTNEDWDVELRLKTAALVADGKHPFAIVYREDEDGVGINAKTRTTDGGCIFANRHDGSVGSTGKTGCAFHHLGQRTSGDHVDVMPNVCWQLPIRCDEEHDDDYEETVTTIRPWDADKWGGKDEDETHDSWMGWWCIDTPDAYQVGQNPLYKTMEHELRTMVGDEAYEAFESQIEAALDAGTITRARMSGETFNEGRPLLPLFVGNREPARVAP